MGMEHVLHAKERGQEVGGGRRGGDEEANGDIVCGVKKWVGGKGEGRGVIVDGDVPGGKQCENKPDNDPRWDVCERRGGGEADDLAAAVPAGAPRQGPSSPDGGCPSRGRAHHIPFLNATSISGTFSTCSVAVLGSAEDGADM